MELEIRHAEKGKLHQNTSAARGDLFFLLRHPSAGAVNPTAGGIPETNRCSGTRSCTRASIHADHAHKASRTATGAWDTLFDVGLDMIVTMHCNRKSWRVERKSSRCQVWCRGLSLPEYGKIKTTESHAQFPIYSGKCWTKSLPALKQSSVGASFL